MSFNGFPSTSAFPSIPMTLNYPQDPNNPYLPYYFFMPSLNISQGTNPNLNPSTSSSLPSVQALTPSPENNQKTVDSNSENKEGVRDVGKNLKTKTTFCRCSKSNCRKEYCFCYKNGRSCNESCICIGCKNDEDSLNIKHSFKKLASITCNCSKSKC